MKKISLLPADAYIVINKTILTDNDKKILINLYEPIIGSDAISLYLTLWSDLDKLELMSKDFNHHHLMTLLKMSLEKIEEARKTLEGVGLLKTYLKSDDSINHYIYELYSPISAHEFFNHPVLNIILYNNLGINEYESLLNLYKKPNFNYHDYQDITSSISETFKAEALSFNNENLQKKNKASVKIDNLIDFNLLIGSIPNKILNEKAFNIKTKELINSLAFIYNLDNLKIIELIRISIDESGLINKNILQKEARKYYEYTNNGSLPTLIYRTQPEHLKSPKGNSSNRGKMLYIFENTTPYDFLRSKSGGIVPTSRDLKLLEYLAIELNMAPAVINVLIDYALRVNDKKLNKNYVEAIAGQWMRLGIKTASDAMSALIKEHKKSNKKVYINKEVNILPSWFNEENKTESISEEEKKEIELLLSEFK